MYSSAFPRKIADSCKSPRVLLLQTRWDDHVFNGVARYCNEHGLILDSSVRWTDELPDLDAMVCAGIIAQIGPGPRRNEFLQFIADTSLPVVDMEGDGALAGAPAVLLDYRAVVKVAREHLAQRGFTRPAFVASDNYFFRRGFHPMLDAASAEVGVCEFIRASELPAVINKPGPQALITTSDLDASLVIEMCRAAGREVPDDVAVLGVGDNALLCSSAPIGISSVDCDLEGQGHAAAGVLHRMLENAASRGSPKLIEPRGVVQRRSTDTIAIPDAAASHALRYLRDNYMRPLGLVEILKELGSSAGRTGRIFRKHVGWTMAQELMRLRVGRASLMLKDEKMKLADIAQRCGFSDRYQFERAFCRLHHCTPWNYRQRLRSGDAEELTQTLDQIVPFPDAPENLQVQRAT